MVENIWILAFYRPHFVLSVGNIPIFTQSQTGAKWPNFELPLRVKIHPMWPKFCVALVARYDLLSQQNLEPLNYLFLFWIYHHYTPVTLLLCCDNTKNSSMATVQISGTLREITVTITLILFFLHRRLYQSPSLPVNMFLIWGMPFV